jgi:hypothetical protein
MCSGRNGLGGNPVTSTALGLQLLCSGIDDSIWVDLAIHVGFTGCWMNGIGGRSHWFRSVSEMVTLFL